MRWWHLGHTWAAVLAAVALKVAVVEVVVVVALERVIVVELLVEAEVAVGVLVVLVDWQPWVEGLKKLLGNIELYLIISTYQRVN